MNCGRPTGRERVAIRCLQTISGAWGEVCSMIIRSRAQTWFLSRTPAEQKAREHTEDTQK